MNRTNVNHLFCRLSFLLPLPLGFLNWLDLLVEPLADYLRLGGDLEVERHVSRLGPLPHLPGSVVTCAGVRGLNLVFNVKTSLTGLLMLSKHLGKVLVPAWECALLFSSSR